MRRTPSSNIVLVLVLAPAALVAACQRMGSQPRNAAATRPPAATGTTTTAAAASGPGAPDSTALLTATDSAAGEVVGNEPVASSTSPAGRWLTDPNVLSMLAMMNAHQSAAANVELKGWHSDTVRAFATGIVRQASDLQHSIDSVADRLHLTPAAPALAAPVDAAMAARVDSLNAIRGPALDRTFVAAAIANLQTIATYSEQLSSVAEHPETQALLGGAATRAEAAVAQGRLLLARFAVADSAAADSAAHPRQPRGRRTP